MCPLQPLYLTALLTYSERETPHRSPGRQALIADSTGEENRVMEVTALKDTNISQPVRVGLNPSDSHRQLRKQKHTQHQDDSA